MFDRAEPRKMGKRGTLRVGGETLKRVPIFELPGGRREVPVPMSRLRSFDTVDELPEFATVTHSGFEYDAELLVEDGEAFFVFDVENF